jgi:prolyl-tRNA synthetase
MLLLLFKLIKETSDKIYQDLSKMGYEILLDDRDLGYGSKIKDSELLGIPLNIVIGNKFVKEDLVEIQTRQGDSSLTKLDDLNEILDHYKNY